MRKQTAVNHCYRFMSIMNEIYSDARINARSIDSIFDQVKDRIYSTGEFDRCPSWVREKLLEHANRLADGLHEVRMSYEQFKRLTESGGEPECLIYKHRLDGEVLSFEEIQEKAGNDPDVWNRLEGAFVWAHRPDRVFDGWRKVRK